MKLTRRQEEFIVGLIDLNREVDGPIHYSVLAERLGVSPFTAYDMLCVLEEKGMVSSEYKLAAGKSGPGRAERLFCPVIGSADRNAKSSEKNSVLDFDEAELKDFIVEKIRRGDIPNREVAEALLARIASEGSGAVGYCTDVMTVVALRLQERVRQKKVMNYLHPLLQAGSDSVRGKLTLLGGFAFGLLVQEETSNQEWSQMLSEHMLQYQDLVIAMNDVEILQLADALAAVFAPVGVQTVVEAC